MSHFIKDIKELRLEVLPLKLINVVSIIPNLSQVAFTILLSIIRKTKRF